ncbi:MAG: gliding motility-associated C-terminal domain-containing protein [Bacteroidetes bacterium]|nr:gliding motility-associated C-terminal domain-containing protein [Bacteroidota bacterium]MCB0843092.1 gliding motility-associated C-terminal domain-containing protein [Bacteroidota bacterium]MCB0851059.1 gliding motility-associated C-terminal domain-containing protein [Bacteroidota bacterium]
MNRFLSLLVVVLCVFNSITIQAQNEPPDTGNTSCNAYIPMAISPNGDGINDYLKVESECPIEVFTLRVFDASDKLIFETRNNAETWDGSYNGNPLPSGHYTWNLTYLDQRSGNRVKQSGEVILVR